MTKITKLENMNESIQTAVSDPVYTKAVKEMLDYPHSRSYRQTQKLRHLKLKVVMSFLKPFENRVSLTVAIPLVST